jgi:hypothetical protein
MMGCSIAVAGMIYYSHAQTKDAAAATPTAAASDKEPLLANKV